MADLVAKLDALAPRLEALVRGLPAERAAEEAEAAEAMGECLRELRRMAPELGPSRELFFAAGGEREQRHRALRQLLHDIRSPASVLYSYLQLIGRGLLFAHASDDVRAQANGLVEAVRLLHDEYLQTPPLNVAG